MNINDVGGGRHAEDEYDVNATLRSNRSGRSARSLHNVLKDMRSYQPAQQSSPSRRSRQQQQTLPPPPYRASHSPTPQESHHDASPAMSLASTRWDDAGREPRWSGWTADTTLNLSDGGDYQHHKEAMALAGESSTARIQRSDRRMRRPAMDDSYDPDEADQDEAGTSFSSPPSRASTPPSPTSEAALDAALSTTMLALTTANSLLLSTMSSRRELARLRALEAAMDQEMTRKETELRRKIDSNNRMISWMERASKRLDDVIQGRDFEGGDISMSIEELEELTNTNRSGRPTSSRPSAIFMARHNPAASAVTADAREVPLPFGHVEAKDEGATVGKSAAKRLERMLQRSQAAGAGGSEATVTGSSIATKRASMQHSRASSTGTSASGAEVEAAATQRNLTAGNVVRPSAFQQVGGNALQLRLSTSKPASPLAATSAGALSADGTPISERGLLQLDGATSASSRQSYSGRSESDFSTAPSSHRGAGEADGAAADGPASRLLSSLLTARPNAASTLSMLKDANDASVAKQSTASRPTSSQFLTPPMPNLDLPADGGAGSNSSLLHRPSLTHIRSPSALHVSGRSGGGGPSVGGQGVAVNDVVHGKGGTQRNKGALEALRRLNSTGATSPTSGSALGAHGEQANGASGGTGWGGTLASWIRIGGGAADQSVSSDADAPTEA